MFKNIEIIAEVKTHSPFGWTSDKAWSELFTLASEIGDIISVHTDTRWGGSFDLIRKARRLTKKPILAKGIHKNDELIARALDAGADLVLVVGRIPKFHPEKCIIEPLQLKELVSLPDGARAMWNSRNLSDGTKKKETFHEARSLWKGWLCQASFITTVHDIEEGADAVLVGTHLAKFAESLKKL